jgi:hypothetical protein
MKLNKLEMIVAYIWQSYPFKNELSDARLTKLVYLTDWFHSVYTGRQATDIIWVFNHYGPYVDDVFKLAKENPYFDIEYVKNYYGDDKSVIVYKGSKVCLDIKTENIIQLVIDKTKDMYFNEFIDYVYSTYPIKNNNRYTTLDLQRIAAEYRNL